MKMKAPRRKGRKQGMGNQEKSLTGGYGYADLGRVKGSSVLWALS
jgi:hypothetical protein